MTCPGPGGQDSGKQRKAKLYAEESPTEAH